MSIDFDWMEDKKKWIFKPKTVKVATIVRPRKKRDWQSSFFSVIYFSKWFVSLLITIGTSRPSNTWIRMSIYTNIFMHFVFSNAYIYEANAFGVVSLFLQTFRMFGKRPKGSNKFWIMYVSQYIVNWVCLLLNVRHLGFVITHTHINTKKSVYENRKKKIQVIAESLNHFYWKMCLQSNEICSTFLC